MVELGFGELKWEPATPPMLGSRACTRDDEQRDEHRVFDGRAAHTGTPREVVSGLGGTRVI